MTSGEWAVIIGAFGAAYGLIFVVWKTLTEALRDERVERQKAMAEHEKQDEARRDKVLEKLDEVQKDLSEKIDGWAERVGARLGDHNQRITRIETKLEGKGE